MFEQSSQSTPLEINTNTMLGRAANGEHLLGSNSQRDYIMYTTGDNCENTSTSYSIIEEFAWGGGREGSSSSSPSSQNCKNCLYACLCRVVHNVNMAWIVFIQGWTNRWVGCVMREFFTQPRAGIAHLLDHLCIASPGLPSCSVRRPGLIRKHKSDPHVSKCARHHCTVRIHIDT